VFRKNHCHGPWHFAQRAPGFHSPRKVALPKYFLSYLHCLKRWASFLAFLGRRMGVWSRRATETGMPSLEIWAVWAFVLWLSPLGVERIFAVVALQQLEGKRKSRARITCRALWSARPSLPLLARSERLREHTAAGLPNQPHGASHGSSASSRGTLLRPPSKSQRPIVSLLQPLEPLLRVILRNQ